MTLDILILILLKTHIQNGNRRSGCPHPDINVHTIKIAMVIKLRIVGSRRTQPTYPQRKNQQPRPKGAGYESDLNLLVRCNSR